MTRHDQKFRRQAVRFNIYWTLISLKKLKTFRAKIFLKHQAFFNSIKAFSNKNATGALSLRNIFLKGRCISKDRAQQTTVGVEELFSGACIISCFRRYCLQVFSRENFRCHFKQGNKLHFTRNNIRIKAVGYDPDYVNKMCQNSNDCQLMRRPLVIMTSNEKYYQYFDSCKWIV